MKRKKYTPYLYLVPGILMLLFFVYMPVMNNFLLSFYKFSAYSADKDFVGLDNFVRLFTDDTFPIMIRNNLYYCIISLIVQVGFGTFLAVLLQSKYVGRMEKIYRNLLYMPALISLTAVGLLFTFVYMPSFGLLDSLLKMLGLEHLIQGWLGDSKLAIFCVIAMSQWQFTGYIALLMVVGFQNVPRDYLEAASIDGASPIRKVFSVLLPLAKEQLLVCSIITVIGAFKVFTEVYATTSGGPGDNSQVLGIFLYQSAFLHSDMGLAASTGVLIFVITVITSIAQLKITKSGKV